MECQKLLHCSPGAVARQPTFCFLFHPYARGPTVVVLLCFCSALMLGCMACILGKVRLHEEELHALKHEEAAGPASTLFMCVIDLVEPFFAVQVALHEEELRALKHEEASRASVLADLSSQRDRVALSIAQKLAKVGGGVKQAGPAPLPT
eukprot:1160001-Pelagomonas_calceolata.AAC.2